MEKLERQLSLLAALLHTSRPLAASEIQQRVEGYPNDKVAFRRAFERDKEDLRRLGIPVQMESIPVAGGLVDGYRVLRGKYYLHDLGLEREEVIALGMAQRLIRLEGADAADALWKLGGQTSREEAQVLGAIEIGPIVSKLYEAITDEALVSFEYRHETRTVEGWRLIFRRGHWYLEGHDQARRAKRSFRLDRIQGDVRVGEPNSFAHQRRLDPLGRQPWEFEDASGVEFTARVSIDSSQAMRVRSELGDEAVVADRPDGSVEIELAVSNRKGFRTFVLSFLDAAEVLSPPEARALVVEWLEGQPQW